mmetsp:Transcript_3001/g.3437  ORF Transcript_3001/g.3437 Transcript_3001/m.3437 type:complete len:228 (+) Transcript_3001:146-829(+)|eukprot:CAMPEP_0204615200 /NCGR_PEP_ID=MMETSP0717-20131115/2750_1 /ASSEMBLY_ACC=CAM_ASM_000666 /TAXON_ID=230516 /ORGANISM="Chaetoceros curvisetus" /LENGTH=227 /DNA_ID=CAMNT_0051628073 /DNA_START=593 /DNA_END=1276 /DNA_ORIENTATION=-
MAQTSAPRRISYGDVTASMLAAGVDPALSMGPTRSVNMPMSTSSLSQYSNAPVGHLQQVPGQTLMLHQHGDFSPVSTTHILEAPVRDSARTQDLLLQNLMQQRASLGVNALPLMGDRRAEIMAAQTQAQERLQLRSLGLDSSNTAMALGDDQVSSFMNMSLEQITAYQRSLESELMASNADMDELRSRMMNEIVVAEQALGDSPVKPNLPVKHKKQERRPSMGARAA